MLNKIIIVCFILVLLLVIFQSISGKSNNQGGQAYAAPWTFTNNSTVPNGNPSGGSNNSSTNSGSSTYNNNNTNSNFSNNSYNTSNKPGNSTGNSTNVQISAWDDDGSSNVSYPANFPQNAGIPPIPSQSRAPVGLVWQRDHSQYTNEDEFRLWSPSACSAAATVSILAAFGQNVKVSDVLAIMQAKGGISPGSGLSDYNDFGVVAQKFGLRAILDENHDLDAHYNSMLTQLKTNHPLIVNVQDSAYFPNGHFVVAYHLNDDNTIAIMNPDPTPGKTVLQNWPLDTFKLYFSRTMRSVFFTR